jgi:cell wall-associated NlpC family hydrolase
MTAGSAGASRTHVIGRGDSIDSLARKYKVPVKDIARANNITRETILRDGRRLVIPDPPKRVVKSGTMDRQARISGDRIAVRLGPHTNYRRLTLLDDRAPVTVTAKAGEWLQIRTESGREGWVLSEFVSLGSRVSSARRSIKSPEAVASSRTSRSKSRLAKSKSSKRTRYVRGRRSGTRRSYASYRRSRRSSPEAPAPEADTPVLRTAYAYRGTPYRFGGTGRNGIDCSGLTSEVYRRQGVSLPHNAAAQFSHGKKVSGDGLKKGDLVFFGGRRISHVGIYVGDNKFVHASSGGGKVRVDSLDSGYYKNRFRGARRVKESPAPAPKKHTEPKPEAGADKPAGDEPAGGDP